MHNFVQIDIDVGPVNLLKYSYLKRYDLKGCCYMYMQEATVNNEVGLHARPATFFIQKANEFKSAIWVEKDERKVNAKSLLGVLSLGIVKGTTITLIADGADEKEAVEALVELVKDNFGE